MDIGRANGNGEKAEGLILELASQNAKEFALNFDFLFYYGDRIHLSGLMFVFIEDELHGVVIDNCILIIKKFYMTPSLYMIQ